MTNGHTVLQKKRIMVWGYNIQAKLWANFVQITNKQHKVFLKLSKLLEIS